MKLSALRYLVAFSEHMSFSRAAEHCHVSQPTLSVAIQNLEEELGVILIERSKHRLGLTAIGERVVAQTRKSLEEVQRIETVAQTGVDPLLGTFRLGVIHTIGPYLLPQLIAALRQQAPALTLYIEESMTALLADNLKYGTIDAAIVALPFDVPGINTHALYDEVFEVVIPKGHHWAGRQAIPAAEIGGEDVLVLKAGNCFREQVLDACPEISHADGSLRQGHSIETIRAMVASGYGISVLPKSALSSLYSTELVQAIPFETPAPMRRVALAWRQNYARLPVIQSLIAAIDALDHSIYQPVA
ncbi:MAG: hydrogen peroxide-inducible genes activator [Rhodoferax sp.]|uniref:hydrogen peroxide-inducible genes activator n=1 Tax=Rhodoferax sp. TaxID=50421 RepID=UPI001B3D78E7|nr:hydrogen peroxide-inducible genes activator [Rhodoferax sp.]MBP9905647.1 hydrogen peroxide-inducible genes activator [Rhodoferax sp.]